MYKRKKEQLQKIIFGLEYQTDRLQDLKEAYKTSEYDEAINSINKAVDILLEREKLNKYTVTLTEHCQQHYEVEAESEDEAIKKIEALYKSETDLLGDDATVWHETTITT